MSDPSGAAAAAVQSIDIPEAPPEIAGLSFPPPARAARMGIVPDAEQQPASASIVENSIISFVSGLSTQNMTDVQNSVLFCQAASSIKKDKWNDPVAWFKQYQDYMEAVGWVPQGFNWRVYNSSQSGFTVDTAVLDILAAMLTANELAVLTATLKALKALDKGDGRIQLFHQSSTSGKQGNFQTSVCTETNGAVAMKTSAFYFANSDNVTDVLWFHFSASSVNFNSAAQGIAFNSNQYSNVRATIEQKLGTRAKNSIAKIDLPDL